MLKDVFLHEFRQSQGVRLDSDHILFREPLSLYDLQSDQTVSFNSYDEAFTFLFNGKTIGELIQEAGIEDMFALKLDGGRGSSSNQWTGKFGHASDSSGDGNIGQQDFPSRMNTRIRAKNQESALQAFREAHVNDDHESGVSVDANGYVTRYVHGGPTSVAIHGGRGEMVYHNHPGGGNFSDSDLISSSLGAESGIVASGHSGDYIFRKQGHFKARDFVRAMRNARLTGRNYDDAADKWLKRNQNKYGYSYSFLKR